MMSPNAEATILAQLTEIASGVGELRALVPRIAALEDGLGELHDYVHGRTLAEVREALAAAQAREAVSLAAAEGRVAAKRTFRRDLVKGIVVALVSASIGALGTAAARGQTRTAAPTQIVGAR